MGEGGNEGGRERGLLKEILHTRLSKKCCRDLLGGPYGSFLRLHLVLEQQSSFCRHICCCLWWLSKNSLKMTSFVFAGTMATWKPHQILVNEAARVTTLRNGTDQNFAHYYCLKNNNGLNEVSTCKAFPYFFFVCARRVQSYINTDLLNFPIRAAARSTMACLVRKLNSEARGWKPILVCLHGHVNNLLM